MSAEAKASEHEGGLALKLPYQLGRFTLCRELGAGGMATVYVGKMRLGEGLDRLVALKTIHSHLAKTKTFVDMFLDEAKIASQISHPNVCSVYDFGSVGGTYFLALEYLVGEPLFDFINRVVDKHDDELMRALPYLAARILADACEGLHAAHETRGPDGRRLNVVHRDVSPQNLFITYEGAVKVVDFGCAKAIERVTQTDTGIMKGKVSYAAPEQLKVGELDARADVWALGVCLWETLTLESLFSRDTAIQTAMAVLEGPIPRADETHAWVPKELADIAEKALQRDPAKRYPSAREMGRDLRQFIARSGFTLESAELAEWMGFLFEERKKARLALVARAREVDPSKVGRTIEPIEPIATPSEPAPKPATEPRGEATAAPAPTPMPARVSLPDPEPARSRTRWPIALAVLLALGGGLYYA
ncbi:partial eukaryotic-like serine/threonine-protein kinase, partial [Anaerolineae bacterium]